MAPASSHWGKQQTVRGSLDHPTLLTNPLVEMCCYASPTSTKFGPSLNAVSACAYRPTLGC